MLRSTSLRGLLAVALLATVWPLVPAPAVAQATGTLAVTVVDGEGVPVAGAQVTAVSRGGPCEPDADDPPPALSDRCAPETAQTGGDGEATVAAPVGDVAVWAWDPDGDRGAPTRVTTTVDEDGSTDVEVVLDAGGPAEGTVTAGGSPQDATLVIDWPRIGLPQTTTASDGRIAADVAPAEDALRGLIVPDDPLLERAPVEVLAGADLSVDLDAHVPDVERLAGPERIATAIAASEATFDSADAVVVAAATAPFDALAAAPLAAAESAPLLLVGDRLDAPVLDELERLGAERAIVVGAVGAVGLVVEADLEVAGLRVQRIAGEERTDTAALVARQVGAPSGEAVVASAASFADALAVAPLAASFGLPVVLTATDELSPDAAAALDELGVTSTLVIGGTAAVSDAVAADLPDVTRLSGPERYATAAEVLAEGLDRGLDPTWLAVASGRDWPDALAAGPVAAATGGVLALVDRDDPAAHSALRDLLATRYHDIERLRVLGGEAAVSSAVIDDLTGLATQ